MNKLILLIGISTLTLSRAWGASSTLNGQDWCGARATPVSSYAAGAGAGAGAGADSITEADIESALGNYHTRIATLRELIGIAEMLYKKAKNAGDIDKAEKMEGHWLALQSKVQEREEALENFEINHALVTSLRDSGGTTSSSASGTPTPYSFGGGGAPAPSSASK